MKLGIFDTVFPRPTFAETIAAIKDAGFSFIQFDYATLGLDSMPTSIPDDLAQASWCETNSRRVHVAAVGGTYNMIHPDPEIRAQGLLALEAIARSCKEIDTAIITLSTGTRDAENMWRRHPDNDTPEAWDDLLAAIDAALAIADRHEVTLAFEPEPANVAKNAIVARKLLDHFAHPRLKICFDAANIVASDLTRDPAVVLDEAFALLGADIVTAHGKDISAEGRFCPAGTGIVPWQHCLQKFTEVGYQGPLVLHSLTEEDVPTAIRATTPSA